MMFYVLTPAHLGKVKFANLFSLIMFYALLAHHLLQFSRGNFQLVK